MAEAAISTAAAGSSVDVAEAVDSGCTPAAREATSMREALSGDVAVRSAEQ
jgi:hypothetical protein